MKNVSIGATLIIQSIVHQSTGYAERVKVVDLTDTSILFRRVDKEGPGYTGNSSTRYTLEHFSSTYRILEVIAPDKLDSLTAQLLKG